MVKNKKKKKKKNEKYVGLGTSFENCFVLYNHAVLQRRRKVYKIGGALKAGIIKFMNSKRAFVHSFCHSRKLAL